MENLFNHPSWILVAAVFAMLLMLAKSLFKVFFTSKFKSKENEFNEVYVVGKTVSGRCATIDVWFYVEVLQQIETRTDYEVSLNRLRFNLN